MTTGEKIASILGSIDDFVWGKPLIIFVTLVGLYFLIRGKFFPFAHFGHIFKNTVFAKASESGKADSGKVSPYRAFCIALGGAVGMGNISGVASAIAVGGPGALFWMWIVAFFGMMVKLVEITLGVYYRRKDANGKMQGTTMGYIERGIKGEMGQKWGGPLAMIFCICLFIMFIQGSGTYTVAETLHASFGWNIMVVAVVYVAFVLYLIIRGENAIGRFAEKAVPIMCGLFLLGTLVILGINYKNIPAMFASIFKGAFTGTAAVGGFIGSTVSQAVQKGVARSIYSNEAGYGTAPMFHGGADTVHPVRQGLWGAVEVFCDTLIVCTCAGLAIIVTNTWETGLTGATLGVAAFSASFGNFGKWFLGVMTILFAFTTSTAWYLLYQSLIGYMFKKNAKAANVAHKVFSVLFPLTMIGTCALIYYTGNDAGMFWTIVSITTGLPEFFNCIAILCLNKKFFALFKDYKARYMGIGTVDPNFKIFAEDDKEVMAKIHANGVE